MGWRIALALSMAIGLVIIVLSLIPGTGVPDDGWKDKVLHAIAYAMLVLPLATARPRSAPVVVVLATLMGGVIELIQPHFGRHAEWGDAVANAAGAMIGVTTGIAANRLFRRRPRGQGTAGHSGSR